MPLVLAQCETSGTSCSLGCHDEHGHQMSRFVSSLAVRFTGALRLSPAAVDVARRLLMVPQQPYQDYLSLLASADVVIDTHPFGAVFLATALLAPCSSPCCVLVRFMTLSLAFVRWLYDELRGPCSGNASGVMARRCPSWSLFPGSVECCGVAKLGCDVFGRARQGVCPGRGCLWC